MTKRTCSESFARLSHLQAPELSITNAILMLSTACRTLVSPSPLTGAKGQEPQIWSRLNPTWPRILQRAFSSCFAASFSSFNAPRAFGLKLQTTTEYNSELPNYRDRLLCRLLYFCCETQLPFVLRILRLGQAVGFCDHGSCCHLLCCRCTRRQESAEALKGAHRNLTRQSKYRKPYLENFAKSN